MAEDKKTVDWVVPKGTGVDVSHISPEEMGNLYRKKNLVFKIDSDRSAKIGGVQADIDEVVVEGMPAPKKKADK